MANVMIFANGKAAIPSIEFLKEEKHTLTVVVDPDDIGKDTWQPSLLTYCQKNAIDYLNPRSFQKKDFLDAINALCPKVIFSMQCRKIIKQNIIDIVDGQIFNFHFADLPKNRGCYPGVWHLLNEDSHMAVTLHKLTPGIDDGPVLDKIRKKITLYDSARTIYDWDCEQIVQLLKRNLPNILNRTYEAKEQDLACVTYYSRDSVQFSNLFIDWNQNATRVARYIQAFTFPPLQFPKTRFQKTELEIVGITRISKKQRKEICGKILTITKNIVEVQVRDGSIFVEVDNSLHKIIPGSLFYI